MEIKWATLLLASEQERHIKNLALCLNLPNLTRKNTVKFIPCYIEFDKNPYYSEVACISDC